MGNPLSAQAIGIPQILRYDVFVDLHSGQRYFVDDVQTKADIGRVPVIVELRMRLAEFSDAIYQIPVTVTEDSWSPER